MKINKNLLIISHTEHYKADDDIYGWGPTVREINFLTKKFKKVYHIAPIYNSKPNQSDIKYSNSQNFSFIPVKIFKSKSFSKRFINFFLSFLILFKLIKILPKIDVFQFRAPTGFGIIIIPFLIFFVNKKGWFKYAGNWNQKNPPFTYRIQRFYLKYITKRIVTINGIWNKQRKNHISFPNPCLEISDRDFFSKNKKTYTPNYVACFIGRLEEEKGVLRILNSDKVLFEKGFKEIHLIGDSDAKSRFQTLSNSLKLKYIFHGFKPRDFVFDILKKSDFLILPSTASEGFPKVIAEAANFGCIPIVSNVSSISHFIVNNYNGFVWNINICNFQDFIRKINFSSKKLIKIANNSHEFSAHFTFEKYFYLINKHIISNE